MNKSKLAKTLLFSLAALCITSNASALSNNVHVKFECANPADKSNTLNNYGSYISGRGTETVGGNYTSKAVFTGPVHESANIPADLRSGGYTNSGTGYQTSTGSVICKYASSLGFSPFDLEYKMNNGTSGTVTRSGLDSITIIIPVGLKA